MEDLTAIILHAMKIALAVDGREIVSWREKKEEPK